MRVLPFLNIERLQLERPRSLEIIITFHTLNVPPLSLQVFGSSVIFGDI